MEIYIDMSLRKHIHENVPECLTMLLKEELIDPNNYCYNYKHETIRFKNNSNQIHPKN